MGSLSSRAKYPAKRRKAIGTTDEEEKDKKRCAPNREIHQFATHTFLPTTTFAMTRGNQRDQDRLKAQKKAAASQKKPKESATNLAKRKETDAEILRAKQKEEEKAATAATTSGK
ncbi:hypothetical protein K438DRAFT_229293 [Mycena galopus ATCC 62051]|nr:hypothetical protein K438DRAFT_229293 [Mycena galopus ATCC 62051]